MNEGGIKPAVVSICMSLFICTEPTPLSATAGKERGSTSDVGEKQPHGLRFFKPCAGLQRNVLAEH